jgi:hypothetical protein
LRSISHAYIHGLKLSLKLTELLLKMLERAIGPPPFVVDLALQLAES